MISPNETWGPLLEETTHTLTNSLSSMSNPCRWVPTSYYLHFLQLIYCDDTHIQYVQNENTHAGVL